MPRVANGCLFERDLDDVAKELQTISVSGTTAAHGVVIVPMELVRDPKISPLTKGLYLSLAAQPEGKEIKVGTYDAALRRERVYAIHALFQHGYAAAMVENGGASLYVKLYDSAIYPQTRVGITGKVPDPESCVPPPRVKKYFAEDSKPLNVGHETWAEWIAMRRARRFPVNEKYIKRIVEQIESWTPEEAEESLKNCTINLYQGLIRTAKSVRTNIVAENRQVLLNTKTETREDQLP